MKQCIPREHVLVYNLCKIKQRQDFYIEETGSPVVKCAQNTQKQIDKRE